MSKVDGVICHYLLVCKTSKETILLKHNRGEKLGVILFGRPEYEIYRLICYLDLLISRVLLGPILQAVDIFCYLLTVN